MGADQDVGLVADGLPYASHHRLGVVEPVKRWLARVGRSHDVDQRVELEGREALLDVGDRAIRRSGGIGMRRNASGAAGSRP